MPSLMAVAWEWIKDRDIHKLFLKYSAVGISYLVSHLVALTGTPAYANWWAKLYLTAPTITDVPAFEKMMTAVLLTAWLTIDHYAWGAVGTPETMKPQGEPKQ